MQHPPARNSGSETDPPTAETIRGLVAKAQTGDREALGRLFEMHEPMMTRWARRRLGMPLRTLEETRDVLHDAYGVVMRKIATFRMEDSRSFARWLRGIITRVVLQKAGSQYLRRRTALSDDMPVASAELTPMTRVSVDELTRWRYRILKEFERMDRRIYRLRVRGHSSTEVADLIGLSDRAVRMRFARIEARLRVRMLHLLEVGGHGG
jgi:RNA polymerase sigma-70 factor, ECF subfamily